jgi:hypothetical protein
MATTIQVPGPTTVQFLRDNTGAGSWTTLGYSDNDNLPSIQFTDHQHEIKTSLSGAVPEEIVRQGTDARIACALVKWDELQFERLITFARGDNGVLFTTPGTRVVGVVDSGFLFSLRLLGSDGSSWVFRNVYLQQESVSDSQWGNRERVLTLGFRTIWHQADESAVTPPFAYSPASGTTTTVET